MDGQQKKLLLHQIILIPNKYMGGVDLSLQKIKCYAIYSQILICNNIFFFILIFVHIFYRQPTQENSKTNVTFDKNCQINSELKIKYHKTWLLFYFHSLHFFSYDVDLISSYSWSQLQNNIVKCNTLSHQKPDLTLQHVNFSVYWCKLVLLFLIFTGS